MTIVENIIASIHAALDWEETVVDGNGNEVQVLHEYPVYYGDEFFLNMATSHIKIPCAFVKLITSGTFVPEGQQWKERVTAAVFFVDKTEMDVNPVINEQIIDGCKWNANSWLDSLNAYPHLEMVRVERTARVYEQYDDILTGFGVMVDLMEAQSVTCQNIM